MFKLLILNWLSSTLPNIESNGHVEESPFGQVLAVVPRKLGASSTLPRGPRVLLCFQELVYLLIYVFCGVSQFLVEHLVRCRETKGFQSPDTAL